MTVLRSTEPSLQADIPYGLFWCFSHEWTRDNTFEEEYHRGEVLGSAYDIWGYML